MRCINEFGERALSIEKLFNKLLLERLTRLLD